MLLEPKRGITYGPVRSRRLGRSLGINVLPPGRKVCNFNCRYCQYGWTDPAAAASPADFPPVPAVLDAVGRALEELPEPPAYLTFSGNGEPTLHPGFPELVDGVRELRDRLAPDARTAILSNSSRAGDPRVRAALARLDVRIMKLDAGTPACFHRYNGPAAGLALDALVQGLRELPDVTLQSLFTAGPAGNLEPRETAAWLAAVAAIRPREVQIYTLDRGAPCDRIAPAAPGDLAQLRDRLRALGVPATAF
ncbi:MAG TPA: radical SAM protein [Candidatus Saccharimonadales bacterium]|nr:radical SAM protein [Candidatus Saccharimonadales bacterium]